MFNGLSLQYPSNEAWAIKKKERKMACPRSMTQKKEKKWTHESPRKKGDIQ